VSLDIFESGGLEIFGNKWYGATLDTVIAKGTWTASGTWTIPAVTLGANMDGGANHITNLYGIEGRTNQSFTIYGKRRSGAVNTIIFTTPGVTPGFADTARLILTGTAATTLAIWSAINQDFGAGYTSYTEMAAPGAGAANTARIYALEGAGDALTDLCAVFQDGTVVIIAEETTPLDSPIFTQPSGVSVVEKMIKPHPGLIQWVKVYPDGKTFVTRTIEYHAADKIAANKGCENPLPTGWFVETKIQREERQREETKEAARLIEK